MMGCPYSPALILHIAVSIMESFGPGPSPDPRPDHIPKHLGFSDIVLLYQPSGPYCRNSSNSSNIGYRWDHRAQNNNLCLVPFSHYRFYTSCRSPLVIALKPMLYIYYSKRYATTSEIWVIISILPSDFGISRTYLFIFRWERGFSNVEKTVDVQPSRSNRCLIS